MKLLTYMIVFVGGSTLVEYGLEDKTLAICIFGAVIYVYGAAIERLIFE